MRCDRHIRLRYSVILPILLLPPPLLERRKERNRHSVVVACFFPACEPSSLAERPVNRGPRRRHDLVRVSSAPARSISRSWRTRPRRRRLQGRSASRGRHRTCARAVARRSTTTSWVWWTDGRCIASTAAEVGWEAGERRR